MKLYIRSRKDRNLTPVTHAIQHCTSFLDIGRIATRHSRYQVPTNDVPAALRATNFPTAIYRVVID